MLQMEIVERLVGLVQLRVKKRQELLSKREFFTFLRRGRQKVVKGSLHFWRNLSIGREMGFPVE